MIDAAANRHPGRIAALHNETNLGKGEAVRRGVLHVAGLAEYVGYWDADLSTPLEIIPDLLAELERRGARLVMGARVKAAGSEIVRTPWRHYPGRVFATLASLVTGRGFYDTQCGAKLFRRDIIPVCFSEPFLSRWCFDVEVLLRLLAEDGIDDVNTPGSEVIEVPLQRWIDSGDSRLTAADVPRMAADLARIWVRYRLRGSGLGARGS